MADDTEWSKVVWIDSLNLVPQGEKGFDILIVSSEKGSAYITQLEQEVKTLRQQVEALKSQQAPSAATATVTTTVTRTETVTKTVANPETVTVEDNRYDTPTRRHRHRAYRNTPRTSQEKVSPSTLLKPPPF